MIVINDKPNVTHMPYEKDKKKQVYSFVPGKNVIDPEVWKAVKAQAGEKTMAVHYDNFLRPFGEPEGEGESVALEDLNARNFITLVKNTMDIDTLESYRKFEESNSSAPRKTVLEAISEQIETIDKIENGDAE